MFLLWTTLCSERGVGDYLSCPSFGVFTHVRVPMWECVCACMRGCRAWDARIKKRLVEIKALPLESACTTPDNKNDQPLSSHPAVPPVEPGYWSPGYRLVHRLWRINSAAFPLPTKHIAPRTEHKHSLQPDCLDWMVLMTSNQVQSQSDGCDDWKSVLRCVVHGDVTCNSVTRNAAQTCKTKLRPKRGIVQVKYSTNKCVFTQNISTMTPQSFGTKQFYNFIMAFLKNTF